MQERRIAWVDNAKGICVILVVMMHSALGVGDAMGGEGLLHWIVAFAKPFRMPDFFVIAGLFLSRTIDRDWRTFLDRKVVHFAYFYFLWLFIQWIFKSRVWAGGDPLAALRQLALACIEPFGTLWFIYLLPIFFVSTKLLRNVSPAIMLSAAGLMETARVASGWTVPDEFAARYFYFLFGYVFAPHVFALADAARRTPGEALLLLVLWAAANATLAFSPSPFAGFPTLAALPLVSLAAGLAGAAAVVVLAALACDLAGMGWLRYCGANSLAIYLGFFLPMAAARKAIVDFDLMASVSSASATVTFIGVVGPLLLHRSTRRGTFRFIFQRPAFFRLRTPAPRADGVTRQNAL
ncbi:acyltransferase family protein [Methylosinus sp. Sm6]|uniref:acyltransferase family protein n=1 Tax=Methylosinus sp. Sm6 TaxID=2866948 RepID=UPI001C99D6F4|nr:acyltransferase family protein [Methylosinus sp. Sm6]MBY6241076.1 acyltransferase family protein [Methylosinus sp. Sm6]